VRDFVFAEGTLGALPRHNGSTVVVAGILHILLFAVLMQVKAQPVRVRTAGTPYAGIAAYIPGPAAVMPATVATRKPSEPKKTALKTEVAKRAQKEEDLAARPVGSAGVMGAGQAGSEPVRLGGSGGDITLIKKVPPVYPSLMQAARVTGHVILDATINPDGTIGEVKVLSSTNQAFAQSAILAVKQWRYSPIGFQGILTVTVNFTLA
jgi:periplasmic protein TonB